MFLKLKQIWDDIFHWKILCDTCKYDYGEACSRRDRPNARECPDYKKR